MKKFDINIDIGEGFEIEKDLMPLIQSCNIACGGHAGSTNEIKKCVALAKKYGVKIGAHPSYPDKKNFGRRSLQIDKKTLALSIEKQLRLFLKNLQSTEDLHHVKPHGALYNDCVKNKQIAKSGQNQGLKSNQKSPNTIKLLNGEQILARNKNLIFRGWMFSKL